MKAATYLLMLAALVNTTISQLNVTFDPDVYPASHLSDLNITVTATLNAPIDGIEYLYNDSVIWSYNVGDGTVINNFSELVVIAVDPAVSSTTHSFTIIVNRCAAGSNQNIMITADAIPTPSIDSYRKNATVPIEDVRGRLSMSVNDGGVACNSTRTVQNHAATVECKLSDAYPEPTTAIMDGVSNATIVSTDLTDNNKCLYSHTSTSEIQLDDGENRTVTCVGANENCSVTLIKATTVTSSSSAATDNTVIIGGASGAAGLLIIIIIIVVVCIKIKRDKEEKNNNSMELPYATHTAITKDNSSIPVEYATVGEGNGSVGHDNGKAGHENGTVGHDNANFENPPEGPYSNIKPAQQPIDDSVVYAQPEKRPRKQRPSKSKKRAPGEEEISYANLDDKLTDHQKGQFKSPEGIIYTEVAHNETPKDGVQRRENNGPTDYAQVDFARTPQNNPIMPLSDDVYSEVGEASGGDRGPIHPRRGDTPPPLPMGKPPQKPPRM